MNPPPALVLILLRTTVFLPGWKSFNDCLSRQNKDLNPGSGASRGAMESAPVLRTCLQSIMDVNVSREKINEAHTDS